MTGEGQVAADHRNTGDVGAVGPRCHVVEPSESGLSADGQASRQQSRKDSSQISASARHPTLRQRYSPVCAAA